MLRQNVLPQVPRIFRRSVGELSGLDALATHSSGFRKATSETPTAELAGNVATEVDSYTTSGFVVNGISMAGAVLLMPRLRLLFSLTRVEDLTPRSLEVLRLCDVMSPLLLVGCGRHLTRPPAAFRGWAADHGIQVEPMATPQACSTFNFMVQEHRPVVAVLFPIVPPPKRVSIFDAEAGAQISS